MSLSLAELSRIRTPSAGERSRKAAASRVTRLARARRTQPRQRSGDHRQGVGRHAPRGAIREREALEVTIKAMLSRLEEAKVNEVEVEGGR